MCRSRIGSGAAAFSQTAGVIDFAGGLVVHLNAGVAGLVAALVIGKRRGYGHDNLAPFDLSLAVIGTGLLWVGWFGFNGGSALAASSRAVMAIVATHLAASAGAFTWMALEWWTRGKPSVLGMISGAVAGLGTITPASGFVTPMEGVLIGVIAGGICFWSCTWLKMKLGYDDSLDVFGVHGIGGLTGTLARRRVGGRRDVGHARNAARRAGIDRGQRVAGRLAQIYGIVVTAAVVGRGDLRDPEGRSASLVPLRVRTGGRGHGPRRQPARRGAAVAENNSQPAGRSARFAGTTCADLIFRQGLTALPVLSAA